MAATEGTAVFVGRSGKTYVKDMYLSDTVNTPVNWDSGGGAAATSKDDVSFPEDVYLADVSVVTGAAQTKLHLIADGSSMGQFLRHTLHLNTLANRPALRIPLRARQVLMALQIA